MAEGAPLLREYGLIPIEGSNPSLSAIQSGLCFASLQDRGNDTRIQLLTSNMRVGSGPQTGLQRAKFHQTPDLSQTPICLVRFSAFLHLSRAT